MSMSQQAGGTHIVWAVPALLCVLLASALLLRRRPLTALGVLLGGLLAVILLGSVLSAAVQPMPPSAEMVVLACAGGLEVCYIAATRTRVVSVTGVAMVAVSLLIALLEVPSFDWLRDGGLGSDDRPVAIGVSLVTIISWLVGNSIRQAQTRAELVRAQTAAQTALAERLRIARELHDIVAHSIGIIAIQAGAGRRVFDARPDEARDALATIEATSRETLSGLRRMVTGLRRAEPEARPGQAPLGPAAVAAGDAIIAPGVTRRLIGQFVGQPRSGRKTRKLTGITDRERQVLKLVGLGMSNAEIGAALYITPGTAKTHVARLLAKLGARDRVQLVITAYEADLVRAPR
jgi:DNA-binding CsgD family transcriptional regulator